MNFTLTCVTSGGAAYATYANKEKCNRQELVSLSQQVLDPVTVTYNNMLTWNSQSQGHFMCSTRNKVSTSYAVLLTEFRAGMYYIHCHP